MSFAPDNLQRSLLWRLAVSDDGEFLKNINTKLSASGRKTLVREGLVEEEKRNAPDTGRSAFHLELTDKGWAWCHNHLGDAADASAAQSAYILGRLLGLLKNYFENQEHTKSFGQFVLQARKTSRSGVASLDGNGQAPEETDVAESIRRACRELGNGRENVRVRLADLRARLQTITPQTLDNELLAMERNGELTLYRLDNPQEVRPDDREAVLRTSTGNERHLIYFGGTGS